LLSWSLFVCLFVCWFFFFTSFYMYNWKK
jgi:hypothetical protein